ncbi:MAG: PhzF family phenazine biosynthesis protein, partial [Planctomycetota bacterium]|nr:PhzF family phenazine biosynthesis protein [Planctomycetota bacterium]
LERWLDDATLQAVAAENNLSETAFLVARPSESDEADGGYDLRWFTPSVEVPLCGHATLAAAHVVFRRLEPTLERVRFHSKSGPLEVERDGELLALDFPSHPPGPCNPPPGLVDALGHPPAELLRGLYYLAVYASEQEVAALAPDFGALRRIEGSEVIATAPCEAGGDVDFVSRFFAPGVGIDEDPVTGSAHCTLTPYWSKRLGKVALRARQISARGGELTCEDRGERVRIAGQAVLVIEGELTLPL